MIRVEVIRAQWLEALENDQRLQELEPQIEVDELVNQDGNVTPWIGLYRSKVIHDPHTVGPQFSQWQGNVTLRSILQYAASGSGRETGDQLDDLVRRYVDALLVHDSAFRQSVDLLRRLEVEYLYSETEETELYFQEALVTIEAEVTHEQPTD